MATPDRDELFEQSESLYERYAKPLEREHWGEYVALSQDGRLILGTDLLEITTRAIDELGPGNFVFKIGPKAVGRLR